MGAPLVPDRPTRAARPDARPHGGHRRRLRRSRGGAVRIAVLGTGTVGTTLAGGLEAAGHDVVLGTRDPAGGAAAEWAAQHRGSAATSAEAAAAADVVVLALDGGATL